MSHYQWLYDRRARALLYQVAAVGAVGALCLGIVMTVSNKLAEQNVATGFAFLSREAGFVISQSFITYGPHDSYGRALLVGILNTVVVSAVGIVLATVLGFLVGIAQLSTNLLLALLARVYVEALRNIPLLLYLFFWYALIIGALPPAREAWEIAPRVFLSNSGLTLPRLHWTGAHAAVLLALAGGILSARAVYQLMRQRRIQTGRGGSAWPLVFLMLVTPPLLVFLFLPPNLSLDLPEKGRFRITGGVQLTPEFTALLIGIALSASAGIAEIVRSGIAAVGSGQRDAAHSLGLRRAQTMRLVVLPQALTVIIPPLTSSYVSLLKNSSLGIAIGYPELVMVSNTAATQTGQAIESIAIFMLVYLSISLAIALLMNLYNRVITARGQP